MSQPKIYVGGAGDDKGDISKSLQELVKAHFVSKRFKDIFGSTRLTKTEVVIFSLMEIFRIKDKILSLSKKDVSNEALNRLSIEEQKEIKELWELKLRIMRNPHALSFAIFDSFEYMYGLGMQSYEGLSRNEGVELVGGIRQKIIDPDTMGTIEKIKKRMFGNVLFTE